MFGGFFFSWSIQAGMSSWVPSLVLLHIPEQFSLALRLAASLAVSGAAGTVRFLSQLPFPWLVTPCEPPGAMGALCKPSVDQLLPGAEKLVITLLPPVIAHALSAGNASSFLRLHRSAPCFLLLHP